MWPAVIAVILIVFWALFLAILGGSINMILHSYGLSYRKRDRVIAMCIGKGIDVCMVLSALYIVGTVAFYVYQWMK